MSVVGIDVGVTHLGISMVTSHPVRVVWTEVVDIKVLRCDPRICRLDHSNMTRDRVEHFVQRYSSVFKDATLVAVEKQPWQGVTDVEQLLMSHAELRHKAVLVHPRSMHAHFSFGKATYDQRKELSMITASQYGWVPDPGTDPPRLHDMSDAACIAVFAVHKEMGTAHFPGMDMSPGLCSGPPDVIDPPPPSVRSRWFYGPPPGPPPATPDFESFRHVASAHPQGWQPPSSAR